MGVAPHRHVTLVLILGIFADTDAKRRVPSTEFRVPSGKWPRQTDGGVRQKFQVPPYPLTHLRGLRVADYSPLRRPASLPCRQRTSEKVTRQPSPSGDCASKPTRAVDPG